LWHPTSIYRHYIIIHKSQRRYQVRPELRLVLGGAYLKKGEGFARGDYSDNSAFLFTGALYTF